LVEKNNRGKIRENIFRPGMSLKILKFCTVSKHPLSKHGILSVKRAIL